MIRGGLILSKFCRKGSEKGGGEDREPSSPSKKKLGFYLGISLYSGRLLLLFSRFRRWGDGYCRKGIYGGEILGAPVQAVMEKIGLGQLKNVKLTVLLVGVMNFAILNTAVLVAYGTAHAHCSRNLTVAAVMMAVAAAMRLLWMVGMGFAQAITASTMIAEGKDTIAPPTGSINRRQRRVSISNCQLLFVNPNCQLLFVNPLRHPLLLMRHSYQSPLPDTEERRGD